MTSFLKMYIILCILRIVFHPDVYYYQVEFIVHLILHLLWHPIPVFMHLNLIMCKLFSIPFVFLYKPLETDFLFKKVALIDGIIVYLYFIMMCFCYFVHPPFSHLTAFIVREKKPRFRA